jgi:hypothetical protein
MRAARQPPARRCVRLFQTNTFLDAGGYIRLRPSAG